MILVNPDPEDMKPEEREENRPEEIPKSLLGETITQKNIIKDDMDALKVLFFIQIKILKK